MLLAESRFSHSTYLLRRQFFKFIGASFRIYDPSGNLVFFVHQKGFKLREDIRVYGDESKTEEILTISARRILDFSAAYDIVHTPSRQKVGVLRRRGWSSIVRDAWEVLDEHDNPIGSIQEDNLALALIRRFLSNLIPQSFDVVIGGRTVAEFRQRFNPFVANIDIDFTQDPQGQLDRRLGIAAAVLMSAIEGRQSG